MEVARALAAAEQPEQKDAAAKAEGPADGAKEAAAGTTAGSDAEDKCACLMCTDWVIAACPYAPCMGLCQAKAADCSSTSSLESRSLALGCSPCLPAAGCRVAAAVRPGFVL